MADTIGHYISANPMPGKPCYQINDPSNGKLIAQLAFADEVIIEQALEAAQSAFASWSTTSPLRRVQVLFNFKRLLEQHQDEIAALVTREHGKTHSDALGSVQRGIECVEVACGTPYIMRGNYSENVATDIDCQTIRQPLGICVGISPFNFPVMVPIWLFSWAIACGNTFILKPSEKDPSAPIRLAELMTEAGLPPGVLNVVNGDQKTVEALITDRRVQAVSAVASTDVAQAIQQTAIKHGKRAQTFGGAKNHCLVMPDANIEDAAKQIAGAAFGSAGERCMALSVVVTVDDSTADQLIKNIKQHIAGLTIGSGSDEKTDMGPLVTQEHYQRVHDYIDLGVKEGAALIADGRDYQSDKGYYIGASLFDRVTPNMRIYQEEIFGPVLCIVRLQDFNEAIQLISEHRYGNGTAIFTRDGALARCFATRVQVGMVGINVPIPVPISYHSFGGWKQSIFADTAMHGEQSVQFYTKLKTITSRWHADDASDSHFTMPTHK